MQKATHSRGLVVGAVFILDRMLKWYVVQMPAPYEAGIFSFGHFLNPSLFFFPAWRFIPWLALVVLIVVAWLYGMGIAARIGIVKWRSKNQMTMPYNYTSRHAFYQYLLPVLLGGASNVFDRFAFGGVIDILAIRGLGTFNLADLLIFWGLWMLLFQKRVE